MSFIFQDASVCLASQGTRGVRVALHVNEFHADLRGNWPNSFSHPPSGLSAPPSQEPRVILDVALKLRDYGF